MWVRALSHLQVLDRGEWVLILQAESSSLESASVGRHTQVEWHELFLLHHKECTVLSLCGYWFTALSALVFPDG